MAAGERAGQLRPQGLALTIFRLCFIVLGAAGSIASGWHLLTAVWVVLFVFVVVQARRTLWGPDDEP